MGEITEEIKQRISFSGLYNLYDRIELIEKENFALDQKIMSLEETIEEMQF